MFPLSGLSRRVPPTGIPRRCSKVNPSLTHGFTGRAFSGKLFSAIFPLFYSASDWGPCAFSLSLSRRSLFSPFPFPMGMRGRGGAHSSTRLSLTLAAPLAKCSRLGFWALVCYSERRGTPFYLGHALLYALRTKPHARNHAHGHTPI